MEIQLSNSDEKFLIDEADYTKMYKFVKPTGEWIMIRPSNLKWFTSLRGYVYAVVQHNKVRFYPFLHRLIMGSVKGKVIDHKNQNKLDNRRKNLRHTTASCNALNSKKFVGCKSPYKGVTITKANKYSARITLNGETFWLGSHINEIDAAKAYDTALKQIDPTAPKGAFNFK